MEGETEVKRKKEGSIMTDYISEENRVMFKCSTWNKGTDEAFGTN